MSNRNNREINLLKNYPKSKRNVSERGQSKTKKQQELARKFGRDFHCCSATLASSMQNLK